MLSVRYEETRTWTTDQKIWAGSECTSRVFSPHITTPQGSLTIYQNFTNKWFGDVLLAWFLILPGIDGKDHGLNELDKVYILTIGGKLLESEVLLNGYSYDFMLCSHQASSFMMVMANCVTSGSLQPWDGTGN